MIDFPVEQLQRPAIVAQLSDEQMAAQYRDNTRVQAQQYAEQARLQGQQQGEAQRQANLRTSTPVSKPGLNLSAGPAKAQTAKAQPARAESKPSEGTRFGGRRK